MLISKFFKPNHLIKTQSIFPKTLSLLQPNKRQFGKLGHQKQFVKSRIEAEERRKLLEQEKRREFQIEQYPKNLGDRDTTIFDPNLNQEYLTPKNHVEITFYDDSTQSGTFFKELNTHGIPKKIRDTKLGYGLGLDNNSTIQRGQSVCFIGLPNAGKSSLMNSIAGQELTAVSKKSHTTDQNMLYVKNFVSEVKNWNTKSINPKQKNQADDQENIQIQLVDTPGVLAFTNPSKMKTNKGWEAAEDSDTIILVVDSLRRVCEDLIGILKNLNNMVDRGPSLSNDLENTKEREVVLVLTKADLCNNKRKLYGIKTELEDYVHFSRIFITSAETGFGIREVVDYLKEGSVKRRHDFEAFQISEMTEVEILEEMARQAIFNNFYEELPFKLEVEVTELSLQANKNAKLEVKIIGFSRMHKNIIIGNRGRNTKQLKREIARSFMKRYGITCDVYITIGKKKMGVGFRNEQELLVRANRKRANMNATLMHKIHKNIGKLDEIDKKLHLRQKMEKNIQMNPKMNPVMQKQQKQIDGGAQLLAW